MGMARSVPWTPATAGGVCATRSLLQQEEEDSLVHALAAAIASPRVSVVLADFSILLPDFPVVLAHVSVILTGVLLAVRGRLPRFDDDEEDAIGDGAPGPEGQDDDEYHIVEEERSESDGDGMEWEDDYSYGSGGNNGEEGEQQHDEDDEIGEEQNEGDGAQQVVSDGSDAENGVEDEQHADEGREEAPAPQPHEVQGNVAAVDGEHAPLPRPASPPASCSESSVIFGEMTVTVDRTELDCGICSLPLKPPIFQCDVGHVVCSPCREKLPAAGRCHVFRSPTEFRRCHAMEHLVESIRVPCPHAAYGCAVRLAYHGRERHARECPHAPCRCPGHGCGFRGTTTALVEHVVAEHCWPCTIEAAADHPFGVDLRDGFNFITAVRGNNDRYLLLLDMASTPFGRAISAVRICSHAAAATATAASSLSNTTTCSLELTCSRFEHLPSGGWQSSKFQVACMDPSNGLPDPKGSFQFFVPKYVAGGSGEPAIHVTAVISIRSS